MNTITYLEKQFVNLHALFDDIVSDISADEWLACAASLDEKL